MIIISLLLLLVYVNFNRKGSLSGISGKDFVSCAYNPFETEKQKLKYNIETM